jgi:hypothetical protein
MAMNYLHQYAPWRHRQYDVRTVQPQDGPPCNSRIENEALAGIRFATYRKAVFARL